MNGVAAWAAARASRSCAYGSASRSRRVLVPRAAASRAGSRAGSSYGSHCPRSRMPGVAVRFGQCFGHRGHDGPAQRDGRGRIVEQRAYGVRAAALPDPQQRVLLRDLAEPDPQREAHEPLVAGAEQRRQPGVRHIAVRCRQLGEQRAVQGNGAGPVRDGAAQGRGGARVAVDGGRDPGVPDRGQPGEHPGVEPGMAGQRGTGTAVAVVEHGGDQGGRGRCPTSEQVRRRPLGQGGQRGGGVARLGVLQEQAQRGVDAAGRGRTERVAGLQGQPSCSASSAGRSPRYPGSASYRPRHRPTSEPRWHLVNSRSNSPA